MDENKVYKISDQFLGSLMMALQKCLLEEVDIRPILKEFNVVVDDFDELIVKNPPTFIVEKEED